MKSKPRVYFLFGEYFIFFLGHNFFLFDLFFIHTFYAFFRNSKVSCAIFLFAVNVWGENLIQFFAGVSIQAI